MAEPNSQDPMLDNNNLLVEWMQQGYPPIFYVPNPMMQQGSAGQPHPLHQFPALTSSEAEQQFAADNATATTGTTNAKEKQKASKDPVKRFLEKKIKKWVLGQEDPTDYEANNSYYANNNNVNSFY